MTNVYTADFYDLIRPGVQHSAQAVVAHFVDRWYRVDDTMTVLDVGCGEGWWAREFAERTGCRAVGVDSGPYGGAALHGVDRCDYVDLDLPSALGTADALLGDFDLAVCLEVAEHLPAASSRPLVRMLCDSAPVVLFSAAIPRQPGAGHVNCRWQDDWARMFAANEFYVSDRIRWELWGDKRVEFWYRQNMFLAWQPGTLPHDGMDGIPSVVHPDFWMAR